jgi:ankyrin repeat protein
VAGNRSNEETGALASLLLEQGADPTLHSGIAPRPIENARSTGNESVVEALEEAQKSASKTNQEQENDGNSQLNASFLNQARDGNLEEVQDLLERGADPDAMFEAQSESDEADVSGNVTALLFASWAGHTDIAETLLEAGAEPDRGSLNGKTPLAAAAGYGHPNTVEALLEAGADPNASQEDSGPPLGFALEGGHPDIAERLLSAGADPDCRFSDNGFTLLSYTAVEDKPQMTELFLEAGANPDLVDNDGYTALAYTALSGATEVARKLLDAGADPSITPGDRSLMELAQDEGNPEVAKLLSASQ